ncbi:MAG: type II toxin-antitoxin system HipA family toxin [Pseudomonadota bacterium]
MHCTIEHFLDGRWQPVATVTALDDPANGHLGPCIFEYEPDYAVEHFGRKAAMVACAYPVNLEHRRLERWPPFLLDLLPQGAGRRRALADLGRTGPDGPSNDWDILLTAASAPPGALRVAEAVRPHPAQPHPGFPRQAVLERREQFIEYAREHGAPVAGSTGVQGDAPKFLLTEDGAGNWHADGALEDSRAVRHWLVKFPRGKTESDRLVLSNEAPYYEAARRFGLRVGAPLQYERGVLFVPRFDRERTEEGTVQRHGLESLYSVAGVAEFGVALSHNRLLAALARCVDDPAAELTEYVLRDLLNVALLNTDNHGRNTALLKRHGGVTLAPLFDFAPMFLDDAGIARVCRWEAPTEQAGIPDWAAVTEIVAPYGVDAVALRQQLANLADTVLTLPKTLHNCGADRSVIERLAPRCENVAKQLQAIKP